MILVTGGAGFIGSYLQAELTAKGYETVIVDRLGSGGKWRNLARHPPDHIIAPDMLGAFLAAAPKIEMVYHLGAVSGTTATDGDRIWRANVEQSRQIWNWCAANRVRLIYASSAATYGNGERGFDDDPTMLPTLAPLNLYGWSKHVFDLQVMKLIREMEEIPPQWVGLKFFNVYGPNEYHKGRMISVVKVMYDELAAGGPARLFRSDRPGLAEGGRARDFIWIGDVVDIMLWLLDSPEVNGLFNVGTGVARTYLDLAHTVCDSMGVERRVEFIDMPAALSGQDQFFTQARMDRLRDVGYPGGFTSLEDGVRRYVQDYLIGGDRCH